MIKNTHRLRLLVVIAGFIAVATFVATAFGSTVFASGAGRSFTVVTENPVCKPGEIQLNVPFGKSCVTDLADYINVFYRYMVGAIGIVGVAMIMYGGIRWVTSNGNSKEVDEARQTIISAIVGVALALGSYVLLNFINPMITQLEDPLKGHKISGVDTTVFCKELGDDWQQKVIMDKEDVCGNEFTEKSGGRICTSDRCKGDGQICHHDPVNSTWKCAVAESICESASGISCDRIDAEIARILPDSGCAQRYNNDFLSSVGAILGGFQSTTCVFGDILKPESPEWKPVSCTTPAAQHICFEKKLPEERDFPLNCNGPIPPEIPFGINGENYGNNSRPCTNKSRRVSGADGMCEHNETTDIYKCIY